MDASRFIAGKLRFKGKMAMVSIAVSSFIIILATGISAGYRKEIRNGLSSISGDIQLTSYYGNSLNGEEPVNMELGYIEKIADVDGVRNIEPVIYRAGIIKRQDDIHGVIFKGVSSFPDSASLTAVIPRRLADLMELEIGSDMLTYFVGERVKARRFKVGSVYDNVLASSENLVIYVPLSDLQRLNEWEKNEVSALEITLDDRYRQASEIEAKNEEIGSLIMLEAGEEDDILLSTSVVQNYGQLFDWLNLIDSNVLLILVLMIIVAGFNMISGLLILLFRSISVIGILKSMGMTDRSIGKVFLRVSSNVVLKGIAIGNILALLFCWIQSSTHIIHLNPENYFVSFVPVAVDVPMILISDVIAYAVIMLLLLLPAKFISRVDPARTVRAE